MRMYVFICRVSVDEDLQYIHPIEYSDGVHVRGKADGANKACKRERSEWKVAEQGGDGSFTLNGIVWLFGWVLDSIGFGPDVLILMLMWMFREVPR